jgi:hypothetical protein
MMPSVWIDHFMLGYHDLNKGIKWFQAHTGIEPVFGGKHPGRGTQNAMVSLSPGIYLEIIAPDPDQPLNIFTEELMQIKTAPALITWALATDDIQKLKAELEVDKIVSSEVVEGSRKREDGSTLGWKMLYAHTTVTQYFIRSAIPFFIEWKSIELHPARTSPPGCTVLSFRAHHREAGHYLRSFSRFGFNAPFVQGHEMSMDLAINSPRGVVNFMESSEL